MGYQFRTSSLLIVTTFVAVSLGGVFAVARQFPTVTTYDNAVGFLIIQSPYWIPLVFAAFAIGRGAITAKILIAFVVADAIGLGMMMFLKHYHYW